MSTNVKPSDLNYDNYDNAVYDEDIRRSIPFYNELHEKIESELREIFKTRESVQKILELGIGTGLTAEKILDLLPKAQLVGIDFSEQMLNGAKKRLQNRHANFVLGDYAETEFKNGQDMVISVIGLHHQNDEGKKRLFNKIHSALRPGGIFVLGDLMTFKDKKKTAKNDALHFHHLVENARNQNALEEWSYHHKYLNDPSAVEDQIEWLKESGFSEVVVKFEQINTVLIIAVK